MQHEYQKAAPQKAALVSTEAEASVLVQSLPKRRNKNSVRELGNPGVHPATSHTHVSMADTHMVVSRLGWRMWRDRIPFLSCLGYRK